MKCEECGKNLTNEEDCYGHDCEDITKKSVYKISCEYYLYADDEEDVIDFIANEDNLVESHFIIEEANKEDIDEDDIYNHPKFDKTDCPVCKEGWEGYGGNYDELCNKHYLEIEPTK